MATAKMNTGGIKLGATLRCVLRECAILMIGVVVSLIASLLGNAGRDFTALAAAIVLPIVFCLVRAAFVSYPSTELTKLRRTTFQFTLGLALASLLVFEMGVAMFVGVADIPIGAWLVVGGCGSSYVLLYTVAQTASGFGDHAPHG